MTLRPANRTFWNTVSRLSMEDATRQLHAGRLSQDYYDRYWDLWAWATLRWSGPAASLQQAFIDKHGVRALSRRFTRLRRLAYRITGRTA